MDFKNIKCNICSQYFSKNNWNEIVCFTCNKIKCFELMCNNLCDDTLYCIEHKEMQLEFEKKCSEEYKKIL